MNEQDAFTPDELALIKTTYEKLYGKDADDLISELTKLNYKPKATEVCWWLTKTLTWTLKIYDASPGHWKPIVISEIPGWKRDNKALLISTIGLNKLTIDFMSDDDRIELVWDIIEQIKAVNG